MTEIVMFFIVVLYGMLCFCVIILCYIHLHSAQDNDFTFNNRKIS